MPSRCCRNGASVRCLGDLPWPRRAAASPERAPARQGDRSDLPQSFYAAIGGGCRRPVRRPDRLERLLAASAPRAASGRFAGDGELARLPGLRPTMRRCRSCWLRRSSRGRRILHREVRREDRPAFLVVLQTGPSLAAAELKSRRDLTAPTAAGTATGIAPWTATAGSRQDPPRPAAAVCLPAKSGPRRLALQPGAVASTAQR